MTKAMKPFLGMVTLLLAMVSLFVGSYFNAKHNAVAAVKSEIRTRVALDHEKIGLEQPFFKNAANAWHKNAYIAELNKKLIEHQSPIVISTLEAFADVSSIPQTVKDHQDTLILTKAFGYIVIRVKDVSVFPYHGLAIPVLLSVLLGYYWFFYTKVQTNQRKKIMELKELQDEKPICLIIDLYHKTLQLGEKGTKVELANKPLCFYLALLEFSALNPNTILNANKDLPDEFLNLANKYFFRLVEIGHTIRKRPNFTNSLEKTLSEIRAALDETFLDNTELKATFYPPKASGEGSRSKLHSFSLPLVNLDVVVVHGK